jgi:hypothetical protein
MGGWEGEWAGYHPCNRPACQKLCPELPEVETTVAGLRSVLEGQVLTLVEPRRADLRTPFPAGPAPADDRRAGDAWAAAPNMA